MTIRKISVFFAVLLAGIVAVVFYMLWYGKIVVVEIESGRRYHTEWAGTRVGKYIAPKDFSNNKIFFLTSISFGKDDYVYELKSNDQDIYFTSGDPPPIQSERPVNWKDLFTYSGFFCYSCGESSFLYKNSK